MHCITPIVYISANVFSYLHNVFAFSPTKQACRYNGIRGRNGPALSIVAKTFFNPPMIRGEASVTRARLGVMTRVSLSLVLI